MLPQKRYGRGRYSVVVKGSISPQLQWIASKCGNGTGKIKKNVVSKWGSGSIKCLLLNGLDDFVLNKICSCFASLSEGEISIQCGAELQSMMKM